LATNVKTPFPLALLFVTVTLVAVMLVELSDTELAFAPVADQVTGQGRLLLIVNVPVDSSQTALGPEIVEAGRPLHRETLLLLQVVEGNATEATPEYTVSTPAI
jgi:hypothetical protein